MRTSLDNLQENRSYKPLAIFFVFMVLIAAYQFYFNSNILEKGVFTKATLVNAEAYKGGVNITLKYSFNGREFESRMGGGGLGSGSIGQQFFVKVIPEDPDHIVLFSKKPVPECLLETAPPAMGWSKLPICK